MDKTRITYLVHKFRRNQATAKEKDELEAFWILAQTDETLINSLSSEEKELIRQAMLKGVKSRISRVEPAQERAWYTISSVAWALRIAASVALVSAVALVWLQSTGGSDFREFRTDYGEHRTVSLPDGSSVIINGNSTLRFHTAWSMDHDREVWIEGEGFFDVTHTRNDLKFVVHTEDHMDVQVLGTKFNVKSRRGKTEVMLQEGKVRLDVGRDELKKTITLQPGELATLEDDKLLTKKIEPVEYASWKENKLYFDQTPLRDIATILEDTYGTPVIFANEEIANRKLSGEISSDEAQHILSAIQESLAISISQVGDTVVFHSETLDRESD